MRCLTGFVAEYTLSFTDVHSLPSRLPIKRAAAHLGVCEKTIRRKIAQGQLKAYRIGGGLRAPIRVDRDSLLALEVPMFAA